MWREWGGEERPGRAGGEQEVEQEVEQEDKMVVEVMEGQKERRERREKLEAEPKVRMAKRRLRGERPQGGGGCCCCCS